MQRLDKTILILICVFSAAFLILVGASVYQFSTKSDSAGSIMPLSSNVVINGTVAEWQHYFELVMNAGIALGFMLGLAAPYFFRPIARYLWLRARWYRRYCRQSKLA